MGPKAPLNQAGAGRFLEEGGKWQTIQALLLYLNFFTSSPQVLVIVFLAFIPNFTCFNSQMDIDVFSGGFNESGFDGACKALNGTSNSSIDCQRFRYDVSPMESVVSEFDLVCSKAYLAEISQMVYIVGMGVGSVCAPPLSDRFGRRKPYLILRGLSVLSSLGLVFVPSILWFTVLRFLGGLTYMGTVVIMFVFLVELSPARRRPLVTFGVSLLWAISLVTAALVAHLMRGYNWRHLQGVLCVPLLTYFVELIFIKESVMWLFTNKRTEEASSLLEVGLRTNEKSSKNYGYNFAESSQDPNPLPRKESADRAFGEDAVLTDTLGANVQEVNESSGNSTTLNHIDIIKNGHMRKLLVITCLAWFTNSLVYYGISLMSDSMSGDRILNFFLSSVVEIPSSIGLYFILRYITFQLCPLFASLGRRRPLVGLHGLCAVSLLLAGIFTITLEGHTKTTMMRTVTYIGKFGISASFSLLYVYSAEVFPTNFRATAVGLGCTSARIGSCLSPFANTFNRVLPWGPGVVFGGLCLIVTVTLFFVPESHNRRLPQSLAEIESWEKVEDDTTKNTKQEISTDVKLL